MNATVPSGGDAGQAQVDAVDQPRTDFVADARDRFTSPSLPGPGPLQAPLTAAEISKVDDLLARVPKESAVLEIAETIAKDRGVTLSLRLTDDDLNNPELDAYVSQFGSETDLAAVPLIKQVQERADALLQTIASEFATLPAHVTNTFSSTAGRNGVRTALESYRFIRALLYRDGFLDANRIFHDILDASEGATFLGKNIQNGAHRLLVKQLGDLTLPPRDVTIPIKDVIGFQPRRIDIKDKDVPSNHVFGLAIDIDAVWNPHIKAEAARIVTRHSGVDFTRPLVQPGIAIDELYKRLSEASARFTTWLQQALELETKVRGDLKNAQEKRADAKTEEEQKAADREVTKAQAAIAANLSTLLELDMLRQEFDDRGRAVVADWAAHGILTIPIALVKSLKERGFGWGAEWTTHKDVMHFELDPATLLANLKAAKP